MPQRPLLGIPLQRTFERNHSDAHWCCSWHLCAGSPGRPSTTQAPAAPARLPADARPPRPHRLAGRSPGSSRRRADLLHLLKGPGGVPGGAGGGAGGCCGWGPSAWAAVPAAPHALPELHAPAAQEGAATTGGALRGLALQCRTHGPRRAVGRGSRRCRLPPPPGAGRALPAAVARRVLLHHAQGAWPAGPYCRPPPTAAWCLPGCPAAPGTNPVGLALRPGLAPHARPVPCLRPPRPA